MNSFDTTTETPEPNLPEQIASLMEQYGDDPDTIIQAASESVKLLALRRGVISIMAEVRSAGRQAVKAEFRAAASERRNDGRVVRLHPRAAAARQELWASWLIGSKPIRDVTRDVLLREAQQDALVAEGLMQNHQFYSKLAELVPEGKTVAQACTLADFLRIGVEVYGSESAFRSKRA